MCTLPWNPDNAWGSPVPPEAERAFFCGPWPTWIPTRAAWSWTVEQVPAPQWRRGVGLLPAESAWWHDIVRPHFEQVPHPWLGELGFDDGVMEWQVSRLSSGERQRLALLRLLIQKPRVLLLDEPTANLDRRNARCVESLLGRYRREHAVMTIWVSHDPEQLQRNCAPVFTIAGGRLEPFRVRPDRREAP